MDNINLCKKIEEIRKNLNLNQNEFAKKTGVSYSTLSNYESGKRTPSADYIFTLINKLNVSPFYLFYNIGKPFDKKIEKCIEIFANDNKKSDNNDAIEDFIFYYLKNDKHIAEHSIAKLLDFNDNKITGDFLYRYIKEIKLTQLTDLSIKNAKKILKNFLLEVKLDKKRDTEKKREKIIEEIDKKFSDLEIYVLLKYHHKF